MNSFSSNSQRLHSTFMHSIIARVLCTFLLTSTCFWKVCHASLIDQSSPSFEHFAAYKEHIGRQYAHSTIIGENNQISLFWEVVNDSLTLAVAAAASGWVGFGVSDTGAMKGADIVVFEAATRELNDYYSLAYEKPQLDDCKCDWTMVSNVVEESFIAFQAVRRLNTTNMQDIAFYNDSDTFVPPTLVISAWGDQEALSFHGQGNSARASLRLFQNTKVARKDNLALLKEVSDDSTFITANNFTIPKVLSYYHVRCLNIEDLPGVVSGQRINIMGISQSSSIDNNGVDTAKYVHHFTVSAVPYRCPKRIVHTNLIRRSVYVWAPGQDPMIFPEKVSFPMGGDSKYQAILIDLHYTNFWFDEDVVDDTGIEVFYLNESTELEAEVFAIGGAPDPFGFDGTPIPQGTSRHEMECPQACLDANWAEPITVFAEGFHMHKNGARSVSQLWRDGKVVHQATAEVWDYDQNGVKLIQQDPYQIIPGSDSIKFSCYYDTPYDDLVFGQETLQEMCINVLWYYPAISTKLGYCGPDFIMEPECSGPYTPTMSEKEVDRIFGTHSSTCESQASYPICFSGHNTVLSADRGHIQMDEVKIGDMVDVGRNKFSRVYSFGHYDNVTSCEYLQLHVAKLKDPIEISGDHMVFVLGQHAVPASMITVGDSLLLSDGSGGKVTQIRNVKRLGAYAPFTESGTIVVSGIVASSYISLQGKSGVLMVGNMKVISMQWAAHAFLAPYRIFCRLTGDIFGSEQSYTDSGIAKWVYRPYLAARWLFDQNTALMAILCAPIISMCILLSGVEALLFEKTLLISALLSTVALLAWRAKEGKIKTV